MLKPTTAAAFLLAASVSAQAQDALLGETMAHSCSGCHGTFGVPAVPYIPPLAGLTVDEFTRAMKSYQDGSRQATIMNRVAPAFTDAEIKAMADYYAALPRPSVTGSTIRNAPGD